MANLYRAFIHMDVYGKARSNEEYCHELFLTKGTYDIVLKAADKRVDLDLYITDNEGTILYKDESEDSGAAAWLEVYNEEVFRLYVRSFGETDYTIAVTERIAEQ
ncbi:MAG TPA: hypothetical protein VLL52_03775 [Anaerolineae bacterium]|nr:hypothetical protein [Anaerolineae bacterium]